MPDLHRLRMRSVLAVFLLVFSLASPTFCQDSTTKQICLSAFGMNWATSEEAQRHLASLVKRDAVSELFGEMLWSMTEVKALVLTRDDIQAFSAGLVRLRGTPRFFNGTSLGELCISADLYVLPEDVQRLQPRTVSKRACVADPRLSSGEIRKLAERQAQVQAVRDFEPGLHGLGDDYVSKLLHEARIEAAGFVPETLTYCATVHGVVYPIELLVATTQPAYRETEVTTDLAVSTRGTWKGMLTEKGWGEYPVHVVLDSPEGLRPEQRIGTVDYPSLSCSGEILYVARKNERAYAFRELIQSGRSNCANGSRIEVELITSNALRCRWLGPDGQSAEGTLFRETE